MTDGVYVGLDLGTSGLKGVAITAANGVVARASASYQTRRPAPGAAEQEPAPWLEAVRQVVGRLRLAVPEGWAGLALSAMIPTLVTVDGRGQPTGPAVTWEDSRAQRQGDHLRDGIGADRLYGLTGQWVDGRYLLPMYMRLVEEEAARVGDARWLLGAKDYLLHWLTEQWLTDPSTASGFGCYGLETRDWVPELIEAACALGEFALPALPAVVLSTQAWPLAADAASILGLPSGLPVCVGGADSVLGALGLGLREAGDVAYISGTSTVILAMSDRLSFDGQHRYLVTPLAVDEAWGFEMDLLATGSGVRWLARLLGLGDDGDLSVLSMAAEAEDADVPSFLPYLAPGEQGALWDPTLRGTLIGLHLGHDRRHLARAFVNGLLLESRRCLSVLDEAKLPFRPVRLAGGAVDDLLAAELADASGRTVYAPAEGAADYSALGAAMLAASALGGVSLERQQPATVHEPRPRRAAMWEELWRRHEEALEAVRPLYHLRSPERTRLL